MRTLALLPALILAGCLGISFGDDDESLESSADPPCAARDQALGDLGVTPDGFTEAPLTTLAAADGLYTGTLTLASGGQVPLTVTFALNRQGGRARIWQTPYGQYCMATTITANVELTIDGGETLTGVAGGEVTTDGGPGGDLFISASTDAGGSVMTNLTPSFEATPLAPPALSIQMSHQGGVWSGEWRWSANVDCTNVPMCSGFETVPLGNVVLSR